MDLEFERVKGRYNSYIDNLQLNDGNRDCDENRACGKAGMRDRNLVLLPLIFVALFDDGLDLFFLFFTLKRWVLLLMAWNQNRRKIIFAGSRWMIKINTFSWISENAIKFDYQNFNQ